MVIDYAIYKCPNPDYVFLKYMNDWRCIEYSDFPKQLEDRNLSLGFTDPSGPAHSGYVTPEAVKKAFNKYSGIPKYMNSIDPNQHSPYGCETTRFN